MTALSAAYQRPHKLAGELRRYPQSNAAIYAGSLVAVNGSGYAVVASDAAALRVVGVSPKDYAAPASAGGADIEVLTGVFEFAASSITQAMVGTNMFVVDDNTVDDGIGTNAVKAGVLVKYESATKGWILISGAPMGPGVVTADADATYGTAERDLINEIKSVINTYLR